jgi:hypothetical protein
MRHHSATTEAASDRYAAKASRRMNKLMHAMRVTMELYQVRVMEELRQVTGTPHKGFRQARCDVHARPSSSSKRSRYVHEHRLLALLVVLTTAAHMRVYTDTVSVNG